jgi:hypothetical protein
MASARMPDEFFDTLAHRLPPEQPVGPNGGVAGLTGANMAVATGYIADMSSPVERSRRVALLFRQAADPRNLTVAIDSTTAEIDRGQLFAAS